MASPGFVVAGPVMLTRAKLADVAGDDLDHRRPTAVRGLVEPVVRAFAAVEGRWLDDPAVARPAHDQVLRRVRDLVRRVQVEVLHVHLVHLKHRHHVHRLPVQQRHPVHAFQRGIDPGLRHVVPDELAVHRHRRILRRVPHHEIAQALALRVLHGLHLVRIALRQVRHLVVLDDVLRLQVGQGVRADQDRHVRVLLAEVRVVHVLIEQNLQDAQEQRAVPARPDRNPVVRLRGRRAVFRLNGHETPAALHAFNEPVRFRHLVLD